MAALVASAAGCAPDQDDPRAGKPQGEPQQAAQDAPARDLVLSTDCAAGAPRLTFRKVTVARTAEERAQGLMGRREPLAPDEAMLFVFRPPELANFWMKDTLIPLEVAYFDWTGLLSDVFSMPVEADPNNPVGRYPSTTPVGYAIEAAPGTFSSLQPVERRQLRICRKP